jgi:hypothetical protein
MEDIDMGKVEVYLSQRSTRDRQPSRFEHVERILIGMGCAVETGSGTAVPTNAGMLFFGYDPQLPIIQSEVVCVLFRETIGTSRYADRKIITGTLQELIDGAEAFLNRYIAVGARIEGWKRIDIPEYSLEVLREAIINAVVHRDYSKRGESIRVFFRQAVGYHHCCTTLTERTKPLQDSAFGDGIEMDGGFIEHEERGILEKGTRDGDPLAFGEVGAGVKEESYRRVKPSKGSQPAARWYRATSLPRVGSSIPSATNRSTDSLFPVYADSKTGRQPWIVVDHGGHSIGLLSAWKTMGDSDG